MRHMWPGMILVPALAVMAALAVLNAAAPQAQEVHWRIEDLHKQGEAGDVQAQFKLGELYERGAGVPHDWAEAARWYRRAAIQGYGPAQAELGYLYRFGLGVPEDPVEAYLWLSLALERIDPGIRYRLAERARVRVAQRMSPEALALAEKRVVTWQPQR